MELSILVASVYGAMMVAMGLGMLVNTGYYQDTVKDMMKSKSYLLLGSLCALAIGLLLVMYHNIWESSWVVIVTIIGWIALIKGVVFIVFPQSIQMWESVYANERSFKAMAVLALVIGLILMYFGLGL